ncbi:MAG: HAD family hydrolase [Chloroflexota bacterium]
MIKAILFDLDDTLLGNEVDPFMSGYFGLLSKYAQPLMDPDRFLKKVNSATQSAIQNTNPAQTNADVFWSYFLEGTDWEREPLEQFFVEFYEEEFPQLRSVTSVIPSAAKLVQLSLDLGLQVVVATNPLFPMMAVEQRLEWADVPVADYRYALITAYENMHATKPHPAYYQEILDDIGTKPEEALMVGDDWKNDIVPAGSLGVYTYWVTDPNEPLPDDSPLSGRGSMADLYQLISDGWLQQLGA